jgi:hypothetical protein
VKTPLTAMSPDQGGFPMVLKSGGPFHTQPGVRRTRCLFIEVYGRRLAVAKAQSKKLTKSAATRNTPATTHKKSTARTRTTRQKQQPATHEQIAERAHQLWQQNGGNAVDNWLAAETELNGMKKTPSKRSRSSRPA